jgi:hypothetical protein
MPEVQKKIIGIFEKINQLKTKAELAEKSAIEERLKTETEKQTTLKEKARADSSLKIANSIIDQLYFYENKFALAKKKDDNGKDSYGFIDRQGRTVIDFKLY